MVVLSEISVHPVKFLLRIYVYCTSRTLIFFFTPASCYSSLQASNPFTNLLKEYKGLEWQEDVIRFFDKVLDMNIDVSLAGTLQLVFTCLDLILLRYNSRRKAAVTQEQHTSNCLGGSTKTLGS
jgi:hypothetical protein